MVGESFFKKYIWVVLICFVAATAFLGYKVTSVRFDYDFEKFFPLDDEETSFFMEFRDKFQSENDYLLIAIEREQGVFDASFLREVQRATERLEKVDNVTFVNSITNQEEFFLYQTGTTSSKPYIDFEDLDLARDSARVFKNKELVNTLISENGKSICLFLRHKDFLSKEKSDELIEDVTAVLDDFYFDNYRLAGRTIQQKYYINKMMIELVFFVGLSAVLIVVFLIIAFRSIWGVLIPQLIVFSSMVWVTGGMGLFDTGVNIILTMLPTIMFVVSMSDVIHLVSRYLDALRVEDNVFKAIKTAVSEVGIATLLTSITTSIGFFSLYFVRIEPIQVFGLVMGIGVLLAFVLTFLLLPVMFYLFPGPKFIRKKKKESFWQKHLVKAFKLVIIRRKAVLIVTGIVMALSVVGMLQIKTNNYLLDDLRASEPLKQDFNFLDENYGGVRPFELVVTLKDTSKNVWDKSFLQTMDTVENYLTDTYGVTLKNSLVTTLKVVNRSAHLGDTAYFSLPTKNKDIRRYRRNIRIVGQGEFVYTLIDSTEHIARISGGISDIGNVEITKRNDALFKFLADHSMNGTIDYKLTGTAHLVDKNLKYLSVSLVRGLGVSIFIVALIMGFVYRSGRILVISIITNIIPLLFIAGVMGFLGIELKTSTSIIFTIAFGIAVDDTIHFLGKFKHELMKGRSKMYALKRSYLTTGKAMVLTTLLLCAGFLMLVFSSFLGTFYLGLLLCITLFVALIADITILPVLLLLFYTPKKKST